MSEFFQYCTLAAQGCLVALFLGISFYGDINVIFEIHRKAEQWREEKVPWTQALLRGSILLITLLILNALAFGKIPCILRIVGIESAKATMIFPIIHYIESIVAWYRGQLSLSSAGNSVSNILFAYVFIINERKSRRTLNPPPITRERETQPKSQTLKVSLVDLPPKQELLFQQSPDLLIPPKFFYERLTGQRSVRILIIEPCLLLNEPLECWLFEVQIDDSPQYTALLYAWDASEGTTTISCNGSFLEVTRIAPEPYKG
jgi:hypothetical protein